MFSTLYEIFNSEDEHVFSRCQALWSLCVIGPPDRGQRLLMEAIDSGNKNLLECAFGLASKSYKHAFGRAALGNLRKGVVERAELAHQGKRLQTHVRTRPGWTRPAGENCENGVCCKPGNGGNATGEKRGKYAEEVTEIMDREFLGGRSKRI